MLRNKKIITALCFCLGALILAGTAFADITANSGYNRLKDAIKNTARMASENFDNFTIDTSVTFKDNNQLLSFEREITKYDNVNKAREWVTTREGPDYSYEYYSYSDPQTQISYDPESDTYTVFEYSIENEMKITNPFEDDESEDLEKIFDALVGNLKDYVMVNEKSDGSLDLYGSLSEAQIPALVNAITSYIFKQEVSNRNIGRGDVQFPLIKNDVYVKEITGNALVTREGYLESILGTIVISGKDFDGVTHDVNFEILVRFTDINSTTVVKPDLTGKKVEKHLDTRVNPQESLEKFIGTYKNNIVIVENDRFVKIGERTLRITDIDENHITGTYEQVYLPGCESYGRNSTLTFDAEFNKDSVKYGGLYSYFTVEDSTGKTVSGYIDLSNHKGSIYFNINTDDFDSDFDRVFDE